MACQKYKYTVIDMINTLLDVVVEHGNLPIHFDTPVSIHIAENEKGEYAILHSQKK